MSASLSDASELPAIGFLSSLPADHRSFLACFGKYHRTGENEILISEGNPQDSLYVILSGKLHIVGGRVSDRPLLLASLEAGDSMGEINLFDPGEASASAVTRVPGLVWSLSKEGLAAFLEADPVIGAAFLKALLGQMSRRIRLMNEKLVTAEKKSSLHEFWSSSPQ